MQQFRIASFAKRSQRQFMRTVPSRRRFGLASSSSSTHMHLRDRRNWPGHGLLCLRAIVHTRRAHRRCATTYASNACRHACMPACSHVCLLLISTMIYAKSLWTCVQARTRARAPAHEHSKHVPYRHIAEEQLMRAHFDCGLCVRLCVQCSCGACEHHMCFA